MTDTSTENVERLAKILDQWPSLATTLRALLAERDRLRAERDAAHLACEMAFKALAKARGEPEPTGLEYRSG
jgi:hypothetical protein